jgi:transposase
MYVAVIPNRTSPPAILLRESFREGARVKNRTLANLSDWAPAKVEALRQILKGATAVGAALPEAFTITRSLPHGHVMAVLGTMARLGLDQLLDATPSRARDRAVALIAARVLEPGSKLATARALTAETQHSTLGESCGLTTVDEDDLYATLDWLGARQPTIETSLAARHLTEGTLVLYDVSSTYFEGRHCPLAKFGYSRDERRGNPQIVFGVLSNADGCPVAVEVFAGNTADPKTVASQLTTLRDRFQLTRVVVVGDRGMITQARIDVDFRAHEGVAWITALRAPQIQELAKRGLLQLSLFDERDLAEITDPAYPGERLIVCRNPRLAEERARKRRELLAAAERKIETIAAATRRPRRPLTNAARVSYRVGRALAASKVEKYLQWEMTSEGLVYRRDQARIDRDAALDGIYVIRTSLAPGDLSTDDTVRAYKRLAVVERAFRTLKSVDLLIRPIHHHTADRVRAHVFLCLLAYYVEWHMRRPLAPLLFDDEASDAATRPPVAPATRSASALAKAHHKRTPDDQPVQSFRDWLRDLSTIVKNYVRPTDKKIPAFTVVTRPTPSQRRALELLGVSL